jgi:hypothetical protein
MNYKVKLKSFIIIWSKSKNIITHESMEKKLYFYDTWFSKIIKIINFLLCFKIQHINSIFIVTLLEKPFIFNDLTTFEDSLIK